MKQRYKISIEVAFPLSASLLWDGSVWFWLAGICAKNSFSYSLPLLWLSWRTFLLMPSLSEQYFLNTLRQRKVIEYGRSTFSSECLRLLPKAEKTHGKRSFKIVDW